MKKEFIEKINYTIDWVLEKVECLQDDPTMISRKDLLKIINDGKMLLESVNNISLNL